MSLYEDTLFGPIDKVEMALARIREYEPPEGYYVAFSGGKDSCVILDLVKRAGVKFDAHYNLTTVDPPELVRFIRREHPEVEVHSPKETMWRLIVRAAAVPTRSRRFCCDILKEGGGADRFTITGVRWAESARRSKRTMVELCHKKRKRILHPIIDWTSDDIWEFIRRENIPYCSLYDEGFKRLGCIGCPMTGADGMNKSFGRWPKYKAAYLRAMQRAIEKRLREGKGTSHTDARAYMDWWINGSDKGDPDQGVMFE